MPFLMRNKRCIKPAASAMEKNKSTGSLQNALIRWQKRLADWMENRFGRLSLKNKKVSLICFTVLIGGYSIYLVVSAFNGKQDIVYSITHVNIPKHVGKDDDKSLDGYLTYKKSYQCIHRFRLYMDSLYKSPSGHALYDHIIHHRPGLMDSIHFIEDFLRKGNDSN